MKNRYDIIKILYPNYLILINKKNKLITYKNDQKILDYLNIKKKKELNKRKINYLILNNLEIEEIKNYENENKYYTYLLKSCILKIVEKRIYEKEDYNY